MTVSFDSHKVFIRLRGVYIRIYYIQIYIYVWGACRVSSLVQGHPTQGGQGGSVMEDSYLLRQLLIDGHSSERAVLREVMEFALHRRALCYSVQGQYGKLKSDIESQKLLGL